VFISYLNKITALINDKILKKQYPNAPKQPSEQAHAKHEGEMVKCPNAYCKNKIDRSEQKKVDSNFYFCKECGTVVYRQDRK